MRFTFTVEAEVERSTGKFASREEIKDLLETALGDADPGTMTGEAGGEYEVVSWEVS